MDLFATDRDRLAFLLETDAALDLSRPSKPGPANPSPTCAHELFTLFWSGRMLPLSRRHWLVRQRAPTGERPVWRSNEGSGSCLPPPVRGM